tara:strand:- start:717 stop:1115 length:399 start_codon:yes stop_codon:yes gene_type:complete
MAIIWTTTVIHETVFGNKRVVTADLEILDADNDRATAGGDAYLPAALGMRGFDMVMMSGFSLSNTGGATQSAAQSVTAADTGYFPVYNYTQESIVINELGPADLTAAGPSVAVTATRDLQGAKIRLMAIGFN